MKNVVDPFWHQVKKFSDRAFYRLYPDRLDQSVALWDQKFPGVQPYYAVKSLNHPSVISRLASLSCNFDCASQKEIQLAQNINMASHGRKLAPERIIFANPFKMPTHLRYASARGVRRVTADCVEELDKIAKHHPEAEVLLRIAVDDSQSICKFNKKFGMVPNESQLETVFGRGHYDRRPQMVGVSFHVGSGCLSAASYRDAIKKARQVFDFAALYGTRLSVLDIGGGFIQKDPLLTEVARAVDESLRRYFPRSLIWGRGSPALEVIAEPGRFLAANVMDLYVKVIGKKVEGPGRNHIKYYINSSVYGPFNCKVFDYATFDYDIHKNPCDNRHDVLSKDAHGNWCAKDGHQHLTLPSTVFGATCDSLDLILENVALPELEIGDYLCVRNMGAYTYSASSEFNGIPKPIIYVDNGIKN